MRTVTGVVTMVLTILAALSPAAFAADGPGAPAAKGPVTVLDSKSFWRMYHTLRNPLIQYDDGLKPLLTKLKWLDWETSEPAAGWFKAEFDDSSWVRFPLGRTAGTPYLSRLCLRGKFQVTDPAKVQGLKLAVNYCGGAIVYVNGIEVTRGNLAKGQNDLAEAYPEEAFADTNKAAGGLRGRKVADVAIPAKLLRQGVNVLAIELVRAPYSKTVMTAGIQEKMGYDLSWNTCQVLGVNLVADGGAGLAPNVVRPAGFQVWNTDPVAGDFDLDYGDPCEPLRPIHLVGARNGSYSGKVGVGSTQPIQDLKVTASELRGDGGAIPASAVRLRYGEPAGVETMGGGAYAAQPSLLGGLADAPPQTIPVSGVNKPGLVAGAVTTAWATVHVPAKAKPGLYHGELLIEAAGEKPVKAPIEIKVLDWTLPDPQDYRTWIEFIESPDTLSVEYGLEPWSARHWEMMARSFREISETGSRVVYVPLIAQTNLGNEESMIRWIKKNPSTGSGQADGTYDYDFSIMNKYLETAEKNLGKPKIICFVVWDIYLTQKEPDNEPETRRAQEARKAMAGQGPLVTVLDPATRKVETVHLPLYADAQSMALWKPLFDQIRARLKARGLESVAALGFPSDAVPTRQEVQFLRDASGGLPWVTHSHHGVGDLYSGTGKVIYFTHVWHLDLPDDMTSHFGWKGEGLHAQYQRGDQNDVSAARWKWCAEVNIAGGQRGIGRLGADYWYALKDKSGRRVGTVASRYPQSEWRNLNLLSTFLTPGSDGPMATNRLVAVQEGLQECEARIAIEQALADPARRAKLGDDLARRAKETLDERLLYMWKQFSNLHLSGPNYHRADFTPWRGIGMEGLAWFMSTRWQDRSEKLFALAGEVEKKLAAR